VIGELRPVALLLALGVMVGAAYLWLGDGFVAFLIVLLMLSAAATALERRRWRDE
jgi:hypothetical protein